jgi:serine/threonine protein kinase
MAEGCPPRATLESFTAGSMAESERAAVEAHLARCLACAEELEQLTRAQLDRLVGQRGSRPALRPATSPVLDTVMRRAAEGEGSAPRLDPERVLTILDPPAAEGALGAFAGYDILEIAGRGGMGVVLKARDRTLDRVVAIKVMFPTSGADESFSDRFLDEARAVAAIHHDHVVTVHHAGMAKGLAYLVMPFHVEGTLEGHLARAPKLAPIEVARVGLQLARALVAMHARKILHRDIKPSNVLLEHGLKRVRLADFGLAQTRNVTTEQFASGASRREETQSATEDSGHARSRLTPAATNFGKRTVAGTPHYMSPEQARGEPMDARSDLFGLGAVLFQMATGQTLYAGESSKEVLRAATRGGIKPVREVAPAVPAALAAIIDRLVARRPEDRFASAEEAAVELEQLVNSEQRIRIWVKRAAVAALAACVVAGVGVAVLDASGRTAILNTLLCERTGDAYYIRGRFGTYARLGDALGNARANEVVEVRFSGERLMNPFQTGGKPLTIRAANGFTPVLVATNNGQPLLLVDAPLALEGLTLWRSAPTASFAPLISVENAPLHLLNCRIIRSRFQGQNILVWGKPRLAAMNEGQPQQLYRAMLAFQHGSSGHFRNCVVAGTQASAIGLRASPAQPTRVFAEHSLFVSDRTVFMKPEPETSVNLEFSRNVFVTGALLDLDESGPVKGIAATWVDCLVDRAQGALLRMNQAYDGESLRALDWRETNVVYAGRGSFVVNRRRRALDSEAEWNEFMRLSANSHRLLDRQAFPETVVRSSLRLSAVDLDLETLRAANLVPARFDLAIIGEGEAYENFRRSAEYRAWRKQARAAAQEWKKNQRQNSPARLR